MNNDLDRICEWAKCFGLKVNPAKSQALVISSYYLRHQIDMNNLPPICYDGSIINFSDKAKNLGLILDSNLNWTAHVNEVSRKIHFSFHTLKCLQYYLPFETRVSLMQCLIFPIFDYADACYLDASEDLLNKLERLQNLCIRFIFGLKKYDHVSEYRRQLQWLPIRLRRNSRTLCLLFNILYNPSFPSYLRERFSFLKSSDPSCRSHLRTLLKCPSHSTSFFSSSFSVQAVRLWNSLPPSIRESQTISIFKRRVKDHYLSESS